MRRGNLALQRVLAQSLSSQLMSQCRATRRFTIVSSLEARLPVVRLVLWSVDPRDWAPGATAKGITHNVLTHVHPGSIVIMHDGGGDRSATIRALPKLIHGIRHKGLRLVTVEP